ncbi:hypothetical protein NDU88_002572 [Pleurodeles waltl]|uniref:Uncharacterized protein n=1 Tax=Pleurodeles waltl TaxID=8319 RepID=A0AAV7RD45_PLEWA|nr:hypothetical protein NDU88_002572 [Pleurodeles waltl]
MVLGRPVKTWQEDLLKRSLDAAYPVAWLGPAALIMQFGFWGICLSIGQRNRARQDALADNWVWMGLRLYIPLNRVRLGTPSRDMKWKQMQGYGGLDQEKDGDLSLQLRYTGTNPPNPGKPSVPWKHWIRPYENVIVAIDASAFTPLRKGTWFEGVHEEALLHVLHHQTRVPGEKKLTIAKVDFMKVV